MHISKLQLVNYRNFECANVIFNKGVNTIIGENGSGKTNLFRALRLLLDDTLLRAAYRLDEKDFHRGLGDWRGHWIVISLEFDEVSQDEAIQSLFLHGTGNIADGAIGKQPTTLFFVPRRQSGGSWPTLPPAIRQDSLRHVRRSPFRIMKLSLPARAPQTSSIPKPIGNWLATSTR